jgi:hypothetical protein
MPASSHAHPWPVVVYAPTLVCSKKSLSALSYSVLDAARHPSQGGCCAPGDAQENANKGNVVAQSQGVNRVASVLRNVLMRKPISREVRVGSYAANSSSNVLASFRSRVSNPSVNQPWTWRTNNTVNWRRSAALSLDGAAGAGEEPSEGAGSVLALRSSAMASVNMDSGLLAALGPGMTVSTELR